MTYFYNTKREKKTRNEQSQEKNFRVAERWTKHKQKETKYSRTSIARTPIACLS